MVALAATLTLASAAVEAPSAGTLLRPAVAPGFLLLSLLLLAGYLALVVLVATWVSLTVVIRWAIGVPIEGSVPLFLLGATLHLFATTSMGIFMATVARSMPQFGLLMVLIMMPLQMLSGGVTPRESMPLWVQYGMALAPTTHFTELAQAILYRGAGWAVVWPSLVWLLGIGAVLFSLALARFRKTIARMA